jgi:hypothetical protein
MRITENRSQAYEVLSCIEGCEHPLAALLPLLHIGLWLKDEFRLQRRSRLPR